jgi:hypothetical protein
MVHSLLEMVIHPPTPPPPPNQSYRTVCLSTILLIVGADEERLRSEPVLAEKKNLNCIQFA